MQTSATRSLFSKRAKGGGGRKLDIDDTSTECENQTREHRDNAVTQEMLASDGGNDDHTLCSLTETLLQSLECFPCPPRVYQRED